MPKPASAGMASKPNQSEDGHLSCLSLWLGHNPKGLCGKRVALFVTQAYLGANFMSKRTKYTVIDIPPEYQKQFTWWWPIYYWTKEVAQAIGLFIFYTSIIIGLQLLLFITLWWLGVIGDINPFYE